MIDRYYNTSVTKVVRVESDALVYSIAEPTERLESGVLLAMADFHQAAELCGTTKAIGTSVIKTTIRSLGKSEMPFWVAWSPVHLGVNSVKGVNPHDDSYEYIKLGDFYVRTQQYYDHIQSLGPAGLLDEYAPVGSRVALAVLDDSDY